MPKKPLFEKILLVSLFWKKMWKVMQVSGVLKCIRIVAHVGIVEKIIIRL